ncbi:MAG TPA: hypothetical protein VGR19_02555 [Allosphingosinicella sp.]|nr:hypothetical protein [Allosphingosinicella sp.]
MHITRDSVGRLSAIKRPGSANADITISYAPDEGVQSVTKDGVTTGYSRALEGTGVDLTAVTTITSPAGQKVVKGKEETGQIVSVKDELNRTTSFTYDQGHLKRVTSPEGNYVEYSYDARGNRTQTTRVAKGASLPPIVTSAAFESTCANAKTCNKPLSTTDERGNVTEYAYDQTHGGVVSVTAPAAPNGVRPQTRFGYQEVHGEYQLTWFSACQTQASCAGTADEVKTSLAYDSNGNVTSVSTGAGDGSLTATRAMAYDAVGNLVGVDGPLAGDGAFNDYSRYRYDLARRLVATISPDPDGTGPLKHRVQRATYRPDGQVSRVDAGTMSDPTAPIDGMAVLESVEMTFDSNNRPVTQRLTAGGTTYALTQTGYDALGRVECVAQRMNLGAALPASACEQGAAGSFGPDRISKIVRDAAGQVTRQRVAVGTAIEAAEVTSTYTLNGQIETLTDGENNITTYLYDDHGRLKRTTYPATAAHGPTYEELTYESLAGGTRTSGLVTSRRLRDGQTIGLQYDALGRLTFADMPNNATYEYDRTFAHDLLGRMTRASTVGVTAVTFAYDALGRQSAETSAHGTKHSAYDIAGRRTRLTHPDAASTGSGQGFFVDYDYNVVGEMTRIRENGATTGVGVLATFAYDDLGRRTSLTRGNGTVTDYAHDPVSRLQTLTQNLAGTANDLTLGFSYNPASQIVTNTRSNDSYSFAALTSGTTTDTPNPLNQLAARNGANFTYDARGNLTSDGSRTFTYTADNQLTGAAGVMSMAYDPVGRLSWTYDQATTRYDQFDYDGLNLIAENRSNSEGGLAPLPNRRYVHGPGVDEPIVWYEGAGTGDRRFLHADERGSIVAVSDSAGNVTGVNRYEEYGNPQGPEGAGTLLGRFGYTGQTWLPQIGLYNFKARVYRFEDESG